MFTLPRSIVAVAWFVLLLTCSDAASIVIAALPPAVGGARAIVVVHD